MLFQKQRASNLLNEMMPVQSITPLLHKTIISRIAGRRMTRNS
jgi:hypothetical protein